MLHLQAAGGRGATALTAAVLVVAATAGVPVAVAADSTAGATDVSTCRTIDSPGLYELTANVTDAPSSGCLVVTADSVVLSGNGHGLATANGSEPGVLVRDATQVSVSDLVVDGFGTGVAYRGVDGGGLIDITVTNATTGVALSDGTADVMVDSVTVTNATTGVAVTGDGPSNVVSRSSLGAPNATGIAVSAPGTTLAGNDVVDTAAGIRVAGTRDTDVRGNTITRATVGVVVDDAGGVTVADNRIVDSVSRGVQVAGDLPPRFDPPVRETARVPHLTPSVVAAMDTTPHEVRNNTIAGGRDYGVLVADVEDATVAANSISDTEDGIGIGETEGVRVLNNSVAGVGDDGVHLANADRSTVAGNDLTDSGDDGVYAVGAENRVLNNTATNSSDDGIDVQNSTLAVVRNNSVAGSGDDGVFPRNVRNASVAANSLSDSGDDGVDLRAVTATSVTENRVCGVGDVTVVQRRGAANNTVGNNTVVC
ncbi:right-handed parallel beta-helix repeat-containing protein [Halobacterium rubrum]|uniref:right-handed parallel beta-helix repeat-containing protein n=1 Tax=Halobacterium TaxID=2239 RepID=UPI001F1DA4B0|nr:MULTISPECIES: right-handed parallel beta-helix repeat-containing protein [Halobacterium]MDH5021309.1 right-handed parallel beta-helix repeat-containing protein [Halobacterium rubrum]